MDYEDKGTLSEAESRLAMRMLGIDQQLEQLERFLENQDKPPTGEVVSRRGAGARPGASCSHEAA